VIAVAWLSCQVIAGCASGGGPAAPVAGSPRTCVVGPRDTLYGIAWRHDLDYRQLARWNNVGPDFKLTVGQVLILEPPARADAARTPGLPASSPLPAAGAATTAGAATAASTAAAASAGVAAAGAAVTATVPAPAARPAPPDAVSTVDGMKWVWPTDRVSAPRPVPGGGILLLGRLGQDVRAAGAGRVVYTGSGIRGYGNLVIIKHGESLLTSYAHNRELLVHEGQEVSMGQLIARMGTGPHQVCALYFEIRVNGRPADPLHFLSPRN
jgi:lipoprotein NlpD